MIQKTKILTYQYKTETKNSVGVLLKIEKNYDRLPFNVSRSMLSLKKNLKRFYSSVTQTNI